MAVFSKGVHALWKESKLERANKTLPTRTCCQEYYMLKYIPCMYMNWSLIDEAFKHNGLDPVRFVTQPHSILLLPIVQFIHASFTILSIAFEGDSPAKKSTGSSCIIIT